MMEQQQKEQGTEKSEKSVWKATKAVAKATWRFTKKISPILIVAAVVNGPSVIRKTHLDAKLNSWVNMVPLVENFKYIRDLFYRYASSDLLEKKERYGDFVIESAKKYLGGNEALIWSVMMTESEMYERSVSPKGAIGLMQLMPDSAHENQDLFDPKTNIEEGTKELGSYIRKFKKLDLALAAYNAGPNRESIKNGKMPKIIETQYYVPKVLAYYDLFKNMLWPVSTTREINSGYGVRMHPIWHVKRFHYGIDIDANYGDPIHSALDGKVICAEWVGGNGFRVDIEKVYEVPGSKQIRVVVSYSHLSDIMAQKGVYVPRGKIIGRVGSTGESTGPHLDFKVTVGNMYIDSLVFLDGKEGLFIKADGSIEKKDVPKMVMGAKVKKNGAYKNQKQKVSNTKGASNFFTKYMPMLARRF